ncbi:MAG: OmpA family protein [Desulfomonile sp.]|nr:OmpA family protein [Desulfomonile sp.]
MRKTFPAAFLAALLVLTAPHSFAEIRKHKDHDFIPKIQNLIFIVDVSDSMMAGYPRNYDATRLYVAQRAFHLFNAVLPDVPLWQYDLNTALITFGDARVPRLLVPLSPWNRLKFDPFYNNLRTEQSGPWRTAGFQEALQLAGQLICKTTGRTAIVVFTDGGSMGECPQKTAAALKDRYGDKVRIYGVMMDSGMGGYSLSEAGWRNLYEVCKLTGGYCRYRDEVAPCEKMQEFAWDISVREIMFPYPEIFFKHKSADLLPSEAIKLESVANFLHAIPQYQLQIDGHSDFFGTTAETYKLGMDRAKSVRHALITMYKVHPARIRIRSFGEELPRYDNQNPEYRYRNREAVLYPVLPLRCVPYNEKNLNTFNVMAVGDVFNTQERNGDREWAWPDAPPPGAKVPVRTHR